MNPHPSLSTAALFRLMFWVQWRTLCARLAGGRRQSPLVSLVLSGFILGYLVLGYFIFRAGFDYLYRFPLVGTLLSQRILYMIFAFFFLMLVFSNLIIGYSTLFKNRETQWFLSLPLTHRDVYRWKFFESVAISSWALLFLSAPMMIAYGHLHEVSPIFFLQISFIFIPFVILPALFGSWSILLLVRVLARPEAKRVALLLAVGIIFLIVFGIKPTTDVDATTTQEVLSFDQLLRHTRLSINPFLPSAWLAKAVIMWGDNVPRQGYFFFLLLLSNALMGLMLGFEFMGRLFYGSWSVALSSRAERFQKKFELKQRRGERELLLDRIGNLFLRFSPPITALVIKDVRLFWRDPAQWIQFMIFFGLLCIYVLNLRNIAFNFHNPFWEVLISYLNLTASALTLSTLTTRFVFPQFSLEGRRLWILGLAPIGLRKVLFQKFWLSFFCTVTITVSLMTISSLMLHLPWSRVIYFAVAITLMSASLSALAVGLGALFPNFKEDNPSKIVSGFGGTLCLVSSFIYIGLFVLFSAQPDLSLVTNIPFAFPNWLAMTLPFALSFVILYFPLRLASNHVKALEI